MNNSGTLQDLSPANFLFKYLSQWLVPHLDVVLSNNLEHTICGCCLQPSQEWATPNTGIKGMKDSYGSIFDVCEMCTTLYHSSVDAMGVERSGNVPNKFGMWPSVSALVSADETILMMPQKIKDKLPKAFPLKVLVKSEREKIDFLLNHDLSYPCIYVNLGKKKPELMAALELSYSESRFSICSEDGTSTYNLKMVKDAIALFNGLEKKQTTKIKKLLKEVISGRMSPADLMDGIGDDEGIIELLGAIGPDPYQRKLFLRGIA